jgi:aryl-alcohol dehydrogenase-like predicted oxidoreductase
VTEIAQAHGLPNAQIALAWMLSKPAITAPIIGATKLHHLEDAVASLSVQLSEEEIHRLEEPYKPHPILGYS